MFTEKSMLTRTWVTVVLSGAYTFADVPNLSNLREQVKLKLEEMGYDTENETAA